MTNEEARELLYDFQEAAARAIRAAVWAEAYLVEGGESTWDAVKSAESAATTMAHLGNQLSTLTEHFEEIVPF